MLLSFIKLIALYNQLMTTLNIKRAYKYLTSLVDKALDPNEEKRIQNSSWIREKNYRQSNCSK